MSGDADQIPRVASDSETESDALVTSSSSNAAVAKMTEKTSPEMVDYWKKTTVTEADR
jgi:hypothetical protein